MKQRILITAIILSLMIVGMFLPRIIPSLVAQKEYWQSQQEEVQKHIQRWSEQNITKYKIGFTLSFYGDHDCDKKFEFVINENKVIEILKQDCDVSYLRLLTIDNFFSRIEAMVNAKGCGMYGCVCAGPYHMDVVYDEKYHFPKSAKSTYHMQEKWRYPNFNIFDLNNDQCRITKPDMQGIDWDVYNFIPLK